MAGITSKPSNGGSRQVAGIIIGIDSLRRRGLIVINRQRQRPLSELVEDVIHTSDDRSCWLVTFDIDDSTFVSAALRRVGKVESVRAIRRSELEAILLGRSVVCTVAKTRRWKAFTVSLTDAPRFKVVNRWAQQRNLTAKRRQHTTRKIRSAADTAEPKPTRSEANLLEVLIEAFLEFHPDMASQAKLIRDRYDITFSVFPKAYITDCVMKIDSRRKSLPSGIDVAWLYSIPDKNKLGGRSFRQLFSELALRITTLANEAARKVDFSNMLEQPSFTHRPVGGRKPGGRFGA